VRRTVLQRFGKSISIELGKMSAEHQFQVCLNCGDRKNNELSVFGVDEGVFLEKKEREREKKYIYIVQFQVSLCQDNVEEE
jgi:hypothetical protein